MSTFTILFEVNGDQYLCHTDLPQIPPPEIFDEQMRVRAAIALHRSCLEFIDETEEGDVEAFDKLSDDGKVKTIKEMKRHEDVNIHAVIPLRVEDVAGNYDNLSESVYG